MSKIIDFVSGRNKFYRPSREGIDAGATALKLSEEEVSRFRELLFRIGLQDIAHIALFSAEFLRKHFTGGLCRDSTIMYQDFNHFLSLYSKLVVPQRRFNKNLRRFPYNIDGVKRLNHREKSVFALKNEIELGKPYYRQDSTSIESLVIRVIRTIIAHDVSHYIKAHNIPLSLTLDSEAFHSLPGKSTSDHVTATAQMVAILSLSFGLFGEDTESISEILYGAPYYGNISARDEKHLTIPLHLASANISPKSLTFLWYVKDARKKPTDWELIELPEAFPWNFDSELTDLDHQKRTYWRNKVPKIRDAMLQGFSSSRVYHYLDDSCVDHKVMFSVSRSKSLYSLCGLKEDQVKTFVRVTLIIE